ncbi:DMT family transporter [uncultured Mycobacterium sp.]|uniref:DMT family transporter n=1 Tax=uncultured Mycobacterium sp. TaxID=171292 RepID=UPI0035CCA09B
MADPSTGVGRGEAAGGGQICVRVGEAGVAAAAVAFGVASALTVLALRGLTPADMLVVELGGSTLVFALAAAATGHLHSHGAARAMAQGVMLPGLTWPLENLGLARTTATSGSLLLGAETLVTVSLAVLVLRERLVAASAIALILGLTGTGLVAVGAGGTDHRAGDQIVGDLLVIAAVLCSAVYVVWLRRTPHSSAEGLAVTAWQFAGSTLTVGPYVVASWANQGSHFTTAKPGELVAALAVLGSTMAAMAAFNRSISSVSASRAGLVFSLQPIAGAITAVVVLGEPLRARTTIGGALIVLGVVVIARPTLTAPRWFANAFSRPVGSQHETKTS